MIPSHETVAMVSSSVQSSMRSRRPTRMVRGALVGGVQVTCCLEGRLRHGGSCRRGRRRSLGCVPERRSRRCFSRLAGCLHDGVPSWAWLLGCFGRLGVGTRPGNAGAFAGPWGQMWRGAPRGARVTGCLHNARQDRARLACCFGELGVAERSSKGWVRNGAPWKREARTIGATSRPGAQMPIGAWDHRFHGEGERQ